MKEFLTKTFGSKPITVCGVLFILVAPTRLANADPLQEARVSQIIQDVRLLEAHAAPHPAAVNDKITVGSAVRTGVESRAELTFKDLTITRLGANTIFSFTAGARQAELTKGTILLQVPPNAPAVRANTTAVTVAVMGGTALLAAGPPTKFMVLEGTGTIYPLGHPEKAVTVRGGEMVLAEGGRVSKPEKFDVKLVLATSPLLVDFSPLANLPLIQTVVDQQLAGESVLIATSNQLLTKSLIETIDVTDQSANSNPAVVEVRTGTPSPSPTISPTITPVPTPTKFGTPSTITAPNPYLITSGTTITTDPSITTNGVTDFGKIYRGATLDGAFSLWTFGSTSAFDTALNLDSEFFTDPSHLPIAAFRFQSLSLTGNPTIDLSNGGVTKLGLIGVDGITSGPPGGTLTFTGLDLLVLATVDGSINLTSDVSFQGLNELAMYARGAGSNLILNSPISNIGTLELAAEGSIQLTNPGTMSVGEFKATAGSNLTLQIGGSLLLDGKMRLDTLVLPGTTVASGANLTLNITGDYTNSSATEFSLLRVRNEGAHIGTGGNIAVNIGGDLTTSGPTGGAPDFALTVQNTNGLIDNGGNITLTVGGSVSTHGQLSLLVENYNETANPAGHIGTGGNVSLTTGGNLTADSMSVAINNRGGGVIGSGVDLTVNVGGALTTLENAPDFLGNPASLSIGISSRYDDTAGNTTKSFIGGDAALNFQADSASIGGNLSVFLSDRGGTIDGNALLNFNVTHDVTVTGTDMPNISDAADIELLNDSGTNIFSPFGGTIHGNATLQVSATNFTLTNPAGSLFVSINNRNGGVIDSNATLSFNLSGNLTTQGSAEFDIVNNQTSFSNGMPGGSIGLAATLDISAANISIGTDFTALILNHRGAGAPGPGAGSVGTDATLNIGAGSFAVGGGLDVSIFNRDAGSGSGTGGSIGGNAAINLNITNTLQVGGDATFQILNESVVAGSPGGTIGGDATINLTATNVSVGTPLAPANLGVFIDNTSGTIGGSVATNLTVSGDITVAGAINAFLNNGGATSSLGSHITGDATINVLGATGINAGNGAFFAIVNEDAGAGTFGGTIDGNALVHVTADHLSTEALAPSDFNLFGTIHNRGGTIGGNCDVMFDIAGAITTAGRANFDILNFGDGGVNGGGIIGGAATVNVSANSLTTTTAQGDAGFEIFNDSLGSIGGSAMISLNLTGDLTAQGVGNFVIGNYNGGTIGSDAMINVTANNISTGGAFNAEIDNSSGGNIRGGAMIDVTAANITANSLLAQIDNTGGTIGGNTDGGATINMNVSGSNTVTTDATVAIYGSDGAVGGAAININGGSYNVGGTFLSYIDGNGTITFNNASAHADVLKAGVFGSNGTLNIGGGILSADSELKLYAPGSNGQLNFVSNVTLGGNSLKILAANSVTIFNNIVVTIGGPNAAEVYTNNANYTGFGGNGTTTGTFAGAGANNPQPLSNAPPFGPIAGPAHPHITGTNLGTINVGNTAELLALLDGAAIGPDGRITISSSPTTRSNLRDLSRINGLTRGERRMLIHEMRDRSAARVGNRRIL